MYIPRGKKPTSDIPTLKNTKPIISTISTVRLHAALLARTSYRGIDYAHTLQGWLKDVLLAMQAAVRLIAQAPIRQAAWSGPAVIRTGL